MARMDSEDTSRVQLRGLPPRQETRQETRMPFDAAVALHQIGQFATALEVLAPFMECTDATGTEALWLASLCHVELGQHAEAVKCLELALVETWVYEPGRVALLYELGSVLEAMGDRTRARDCYLAVCRRAPWFRDAADRAGALAA